MRSSVVIWAIGIVMSSAVPNGSAQPALPLVIVTWANEGFQEAAKAAWTNLIRTNDRLSAVEAGAMACQDLQCDTTVGFGGSPDETGETTLDALIMDGPGHKMGAVGDLRRIKNAIGVARAVMNFTRHSFLVGDSATQFAKSMGFTEETLQTESSLNMWNQWRSSQCQPNFWQNVYPNPETSCGPYQPDRQSSGKSSTDRVDSTHDTIGLVVIDSNSDIAVGTSTNGASHKIPGRVGDSPIPGAGAYLDNKVGGAAGTGDGDVMMRFLPSYQAVENMRVGMAPMAACQEAIGRITAVYPSFSGAIIAANKRGEIGAACNGMKSFSFCLRSLVPDQLQIVTVDCAKNSTTTTPTEKKKLRALETNRWGTN